MARIGGTDMNDPTRSLPLGLDDIEARRSLSVDEAASLRGLGRTAAYEVVRRVEIPTQRLSQGVIIPKRGSVECATLDPQDSTFVLGNPHRSNWLWVNLMSAVSPTMRAVPGLTRCASKRTPSHQRRVAPH